MPTKNYLMAQNNKTNKVTISLSEKLQEKARQISKKIFGKSNISGLFAYWLTNHKD